MKPTTPTTIEETLEAATLSVHLTDAEKTAGRMALEAMTAHSGAAADTGVPGTTATAPTSS